MTKLRGPLFSFEARGKLGNSLVYYPWKGIDCVRTLVTPANPNTAAQQTQRGYMTAAVGEWHGSDFTAADQTAWNRLAGILAQSMSGFNRMCREFINEVLLGNTWERVRNVFTDGVAATQFNVMCTKAGGGNAPTLRYGQSRTFFPDSMVMADQGGNVWAATIPGLISGQLYYFTIDVGATGVDWGRVGIYQQRTS